MKARNGRRKMIEGEENVCPRCWGTGMVCGHKPEILPGACCVDFANAICPECGGTGKDPRKRRKTTDVRVDGEGSANTSGERDVG